MKHALITMLLAGSLVGCTFSLAAPGTPTGTLGPSAIPPTSTSEAVLVTEALTPPDYLTVDMGRYYVYPGEYSFIPYFGYGFQTSEGNTFVWNTERSVTIGIAGGDDVNVNSDEELGREFLDSVFANNSSYSISSSKLIFVNDTEGTWFDLVGKISEEDFRGSAAAVRKDNGHYFFAFGIGKTSAGKNTWEDEGRQAFSTILDSIQFLSEEELNAAATCSISSDPTYGYSKDNPIRVGGDAFGGPARERAYLDSLSGPNEEAVAYSRNGSLDYGNTILDEFSLSYSGIAQTAVIYIDEYSFSELSAPKDFGCLHPFPLNPP